MKISTVKKPYLLPAAILLSIILNSAQAPALNVMGAIDRNARWTTQDSPVHITGDLRVAKGATLVIDPAVRVVFDPRPDASRGYTLTVEGTLVAGGGEANPIVITAADRKSPWGAIVFTDASEDWNEAESTGSMISGCVLEYGGNHPEGGMIVAEDAAPRIAGNLIRFSDTAGIAVAKSEAALSPAGDIQIVDNRIHGNPAGVVLSGAGGLVSGNYFLQNSRAMDLTARTGSIDIMNNTVAGSSNELFGAGLLLKLEEPGSGIASYQWTQTGGPSVILKNPGSARPSFAAPNPGSAVETLAFDLTVTGESGLQATKSTAVTIIGGNEPPVAAAGSDMNVQLSDDPEIEVSVTLNGAGSRDPDRGIAAYRWVQESGPEVVLLNPNTMKPSFTVPASVNPGDQAIFKLTVTDAGGLESTDTVTVRFYLDNIYPVADAEEDSLADPGQVVTLDGTGSKDPDGAITGYLWQQTEGAPVTLSYRGTAKPYFTAPAGTGNEERLTFSLQVWSTGGLTDTDEVTLTITGDLSARPGEDQTVSAGDTVILDGSGSTDRNAASRVDVEANRFQWDNEAAGLLGLTAYDGARYQLGVAGNNMFFTGTAGLAVFLFDWEGATNPIDMSDNWWGADDLALINGMIYDNDSDLTLPIVNVQPYAEAPIETAGSLLSYPPVADAGPDMEVSMDMTVELDGSASYDPDGIATYLWRQTEGPPVVLKNPNSPVSTFVAPSGGVDGEQLAFTLTVMTDDTFSHSDESLVAIRADETLPTVETGGGGCFVGTALIEPGNSSGLFLLMIVAMAAITAGLRRPRKGATITAVACFSFLSLFLAGEAGAGYVAAGGGDGGDAKQYSITLEAGAPDISAGPASLLFAVGIPLIPHGDENLPENTIALPCPNDGCRALDPVIKGTETGLYAKLGIELGSSGLYLNAIGGATIFTESELTLSEATGNIYEESSDSTIEPLYGGGLSFFLDAEWRLVIEVDYDTRRGVCGALGWWW